MANNIFGQNVCVELDVAFIACEGKHEIICQIFDANYHLSDDWNFLAGDSCNDD